MNHRDHAAGASKSLRKTVNEIEVFVQSGRERMPEEKLRDFLHEHLADLAEKWLKRGFKRGCIEARRKFKADGKFPEKVRYNGDRELFTGRDRNVRLTWKAKKTAKGK